MSGRSDAKKVDGSYRLTMGQVKVRVMPPIHYERVKVTEADKAKLASLSSQIITDEKSGGRPAPLMDVTDQSRELLLGRSKYTGMSVPEAAYQILHDTQRPMHAKELLQRLVAGGIQIKGKTPLTSVATSLKRDRRFRKVGPNTFEAAGETLTEAV